MVNVRLAVRTLTRSPIVTAIAILSLALGIGANTAIFSLYDQILLRPLPVREPDQLVNLSSPGPKQGSVSCGSAGSCDEVFSYPMFRDLERGQSVFTGIAAHTSFNANLGVTGQIPVNRSAMYVSGSYFPVLGLSASLGRLFTPDDDRAPGASPVVVLSYDYWQNGFGGRPSVLNETITVNGHPMTIIGVAPSGFRSTTMGAFPSVFVPVTMRDLLSNGGDSLGNRKSYWAYLFARRKAGVTIEQAQLALRAVYRPIITEVETPLQEGMSGKTLSEFTQKTIFLADGRGGQSDKDREARTPLLLLFAVTGVVLFIACANIANLLLARAARRSHDIAIRLALGASRRQLVTQLLMESCLLAFLGGALSIFIAKWTLSIVIGMMPSETASFLAGMMNAKVMLFAVALAVTTGLLFGMFPALHSTRPDLITIIRANTGQPSGARGAARFRTSLVTAQVALSTALLISAGLFVRSLINVSRVDLGLDVDSVVTFALSPELNGYKATRSLALIDRVQRELAATPGVTAVAAARVPVLGGSSWGTTVSVEGFTKGTGTNADARFNQISAGYFRALGMPLLAGREFDLRDVAATPKVAVVNETFARKFNLGRNPVGKFMAVGEGSDVKLDMQIVGLVHDAKYNAVKADVPPLFFTPIAQDSTVGSATFYARTTGELTALVRAVPNVIATLDANLPVQNLKTLSQEAKQSIGADRVIGILAGAFASLATLLAAIGLYGVMAYTVAQRTREFGVRMALGANAGQVRSMVLGQVARMTAIGAVIGVAAALGVGQAARSVLYGLRGSDPLVISLSVVLLGLVALGAGFVPAYRASRVHPMQALRYE
jgi:predicted permease